MVSRLFYIVKPHCAYFGEKDWQQVAVIKRLVSFINSEVEIIECPTVRESDGLAKSSRNTLLTPEERLLAPKIYEVLQASVVQSQTKTVGEVHDEVVAQLNAIDGLRVEYFDIVDGATLLPVTRWDEAAEVVGCITVYCGDTPIRLIDHITYRKEGKA